MRRFFMTTLLLLWIGGLLTVSVRAETHTAQPTGLSSTDTTSVLNPLHQFRRLTIQGGYVAAGVGLRNLGYGTITISGIPPQSTVREAYLYWSILADTTAASFADGVVNGGSIHGT